MANTKGKRKTTGSGGVKTVDMTRGSGALKKPAEKGVIDNVWGVCFIVLGIFLFAAVRFNSGGQLGGAISGIIKGVFGHIGLILPFYLILFGIFLLVNKNVHISARTAGLGGVILLMMCLINSARFVPKGGMPIDGKAFYEGGKLLESGGFFGMLIDAALVKFIGKIGVYCLAILGIIAALLFIVNIPVSQLLSIFGQKQNARRAKIDEEKAQRRKELEQAAKEREKAYKKELKEAEARRKQEKREKEFLLKSGVATEMDITDILKAVPTEKLFPGGRSRSKGTDKVDSQDMFDLFSYGRDQKKEVVISDRAQHFVDLLNESYNWSSSNKPRKRQVTERKSSGYGLEPQAVARRGLGLGYEDENARTSSSSRKAAAATVNAANIASVAIGREDPKPQERKINITPYRATQAEPSEEKHLESTVKDERIVTQDKPIQPAKPGAGAVQNDTKKKPELTNTQAKDACLDDEDFNKVKKPLEYKKPPIDLLNAAPGGNRVDSDSLMRRAQDLEDTFKNFNASAKVVDVIQGPAVTRYEIQPAPTVKVSKIVSLADDIALNLRAKSIRIEAPIPGKAAIGIEVENENVNMVSLREIIESEEFKNAKSKISFAVGRDIAGKAIVANLKEMPHMLIAGSTGSGKSVCVNGIITSILYKADPDEVKLVLIDPKQVELGGYNGIPHLLIPVVTDPSKAAAALNWAVAEMSDRYKKFSDAMVKDLEHYNDLMKSKGETENILPQVVIIIDELADLMMAAPSQVEDSICRLAQLARAAGMHLIVATQRPSVDIVTGLIKANIPSRIAFAVASQFDSRTILDMSGAEKLVGKGDMLYSPVGMAKPLRVQGCFIDESETKRILDFVKGQTEVVYDTSVSEVVERGNVQSASPGDDRDDEILPEVIELFISQGKGSTSLIQRRFRAGYNKAANIMDKLESMGVVGPQDGAKAREVKWTEADYQAYISGGSGEEGQDE